MSSAKYFNHQTGKFIDLEQDGCTLDEWQHPNGSEAFARHPLGYKIFLPAEKIKTNDEYADVDPYSVEEHIDHPFHKRRMDLTIQLVREAVGMVKGIPQILDLGCGEGHITEKIRQEIPAAEYTGLDYSISAIAYAHSHFPQIDFSVGDAYQSPYSDSFFDVIVCNNLWEHVSDPLFLLSKIEKMLKPGGSLIISTPSRYRLGNLVRVLRGKPVVFLSKYHVTEYSVGQVIEQLTYGGFLVKRVLSRPIPQVSLKAKVGGGLLAMFIALVGSHHQLESTVFYLAEKRASST